MITTATVCLWRTSTFHTMDTIDTWQHIYGMWKIMVHLYVFMRCVSELLKNPLWRRRQRKRKKKNVIYICMIVKLLEGKRDLSLSIVYDTLQWMHLVFQASVAKQFPDTLHLIYEMVKSVEVISKMQASPRTWTTEREKIYIYIYPVTVMALCVHTIFALKLFRKWLKVQCAGFWVMY